MFIYLNLANRSSKKAHCNSQVLFCFINLRRHLFHKKVIISNHHSYTMDNALWKRAGKRSLSVKLQELKGPSAITIQIPIFTAVGLTEPLHFTTCWLHSSLGTNEHPTEKPFSTRDWQKCVTLKTDRAFQDQIKDEIFCSKIRQDGFLNVYCKFHRYSPFVVANTHIKLHIHWQAHGMN